MLKIQTKSFYKRFTCIRNMKNFNVKESYTDFPILPFSIIYSFDDPKDQLAMVNTLILDSINRYAPLKRTKFTRPPAPWMKKLVIMTLQNKRDKWDKAFKNGLSKIYGRQPLINLKLCLNRPYSFFIFFSAFHKFYLVHSWILCPKYTFHAQLFKQRKLDQLSKHWNELKRQKKSGK